VEFLTSVSKLSKVTMAGNPCQGLEFYRLRVLTRLTGLAFLDGVQVEAEEKVKAINLYGGDRSDLGNRKVVWDRCFPDKDFQDFLPPFREVEEDVVKGEEKKEGDPRNKGDFRGLYAGTGSFVGGILDTAVKRVALPTTTKLGTTL